MAFRATEIRFYGRRRSKIGWQLQRLILIPDSRILGQVAFVHEPRAIQGQYKNPNDVSSSVATRLLLRLVVQFFQSSVKLFICMIKIMFLDLNVYICY